MGHKREKFKPNKEFYVGYYILLAFFLILAGFGFSPVFYNAFDGAIASGFAHFKGGCFVSLDDVEFIRLFSIILLSSAPILVMYKNYMYNNENILDKYYRGIIFGVILFIILDIFLYTYANDLFDKLTIFESDVENKGYDNFFGTIKGEIKAFFRNLGGRSLICIMPIILQLISWFFLSESTDYDSPKKFIITFAFYPVILIGGFLLTVIICNIITNILAVFFTFIVFAMIFCFIFGVGAFANKEPSWTTTDGTKIYHNSDGYYDLSGNRYDRVGDTFTKRN